MLPAAAPVQDPERGWESGGEECLLKSAYGDASNCAQVGTDPTPE